MREPVLMLVCNYKPQALLGAYQIFKDGLFFYSCIYYPDAFVTSSYSSPNLFIILYYFSLFLYCRSVNVPLASFSLSLSVTEHQ